MFIIQSRNFPNIREQALEEASYSLSHRREKNVFALFTFSTMISSFKYFFFFLTSYTSCFTLFNIIVSVTIKLSICPSLLPVSHQRVFSYSLSFSPHRTIER